MKIFLLILCLVLNMLCVVSVTNLRGNDISFWDQKIARLYGNNHMIESDISRILKKNNNKNNKNNKNKDKNNKNQNKKDRNKEKDKKDKKCNNKKKHNCDPPTSSPTIIPPMLNLTGTSCGLFCDGKGSTCDTPDSCCETNYVACDATDFGQAGYYHCGRATSYLGQCVEHEVIVKHVNAPLCSQFCDGMRTSCTNSMNCCPSGYILCDRNDLTLQETYSSGGFNGAMYRCGKVNSYTPSGDCVPLYPTPAPATSEPTGHPTMNTSIDYIISTQSPSLSPSHSSETFSPTLSSSVAPTSDLSLSSSHKPSPHPSTSPTRTITSSDSEAPTHSTVTSDPTMTSASMMPTHSGTT